MKRKESFGNISRLNTTARGMECPVKITIAAILAAAAMTLLPAAAISEAGRHIPEKKGNASGNKKIRITMAAAVSHLLQNGYDVREAVLDYRAAGNGALSFRGAYDTVISASGKAGSTVNPDLRTKLYDGDSRISQDYSLGVSQYVPSGTSLSLRLESSVTDTKYSPLSKVAGYNYGYRMGFQTALNAQIAQELLNNSFGMNDRKTLKVLQGKAHIAKMAASARLTRLVSDMIVVYYNTVIAEEALRSAEAGLKSTEDIRAVVAKKQAFSLAGPEDVLDWNGRVLTAANVRDAARQAERDSRRALLRIINLDARPEEVELERTLSTAAPGLDMETAVRDAFTRRVDLNNQKLAVKNTRLDLQIALNKALPSLKVAAGARIKDFDRDRFTSSLGFVNAEYRAGFEISYPIGDRTAEARVRDARTALSKEEIALDRMERAVRDEVVETVERCAADYAAYGNAVRAREYAYGCYRQTLARFQRGQCDTLHVKPALDAYLQSMQMELAALVAYNVSLIRRDVARNTLLDTLGIDAVRMLERMK